MKKGFLLVIVLAYLFLPVNLFSQDKAFGLGIMIGQPTGFSAKYWLNNEHAVDFGLAYSFIGGDKGFSLHSDYLYHINGFTKSNIKLPVYYGFGARIRSVDHSKTYLGARGVVGLVYMNNVAPFDVFLELAPIFNLFPETSLNFDLALGLRYYFD